jgi:hypothetical protein
MESMFSSPGKEAQQGASGVQGINTQTIDQLENYVGQQQQSERAGIAGIDNPYFSAAQSMSPAPYRVNPAQTQTFGASGPGTYLANLSSKSAGGAPPAWNPVPRGAFGGGNGSDGGGNGKVTPPIMIGPGGGNMSNPPGARGHNML